MTVSDFQLQEQFVLFIDFLGTSDAAKNWNEEQTQPLLELLSELSQSKAAFDIKGSPNDDGSYTINLTPEVTTFSDHVVASYPTYALEDARKTNSQLPDIIFDAILEHTQKIVGIIALKALNIGLLMRGGFTIGKLYHSSGVVFGEGMVDAYNLENKVAIYPRIAVSPRIYSQLPKYNRGLIATLSASRLLKDIDGIWHLNYFRRLDNLMEAAGKTPGDVKSWRKISLEKIDEQIKRFEEKERLNELKKWSWFKEHFNTTA